MLKFTAICSGLLSVTVLCAAPAQAVLVTSRFSVGAYAAKENFSDRSQGSNINNFQTISSRAYLKLQKLGAFEFTADLRDKHDFFDKLDAERLQLTTSNDFQVRELNTHYPNPQGIVYATLGRFAILEAGSVFNDGAEIGSRLGSQLRLAAFGGHNPKRPEDTYMRSDTPDLVYGGYLSFQSKGASWTQFFNASTAYVENSAYSHVDRRYQFLQTHWQWNSSSRLINNLYLDFVPRTYLQNGNIIYQQGWGARFDTSLQLTAFDSIEYSRRRGVLETLPSSAYQEISLGTRLKATDRIHWLTLARTGERMADHMRRQDASTGFNFSELFSPKFDLTMYAGYSKEFTVEGPTSRLEANYYSRNWEIGQSLEAAIQRGRQTLHPFVAELSIANMYSRALYSTVAVQYAQNENVTIYSGFFKLTYRYGSEDLPPLRDGTPPRRSL